MKLPGKIIKVLYSRIWKRAVKTVFFIYPVAGRKLQTVCNACSYKKAIPVCGMALHIKTY